MKKLSKILLGAGIVACLAACDRKAEFTTSSFVALQTSSAEVAEDAGSLQIPVYAYAKNGDYAFPRSESASTSVTFEIVDGTAVNGTDFTVEPANGVLTFSGSSEGSITVKPVDHDGKRTGDLSFTIRLTGASDGYTLGGSREVSVTIRDLDHPLANVLGKYVAAGVTDYFGDTYDIEINVEAVSGSETEVTISNMCPYIASLGYSHTVAGVVSEDHSTITITTPQVVGNVAYFYAVAAINGTQVSFGETLILNVDEEKGTITADNTGWASYNEGFYDLIYGTVVFSKQ